MATTAGTCRTSSVCPAAQAQGADRNRCGSGRFNSARKFRRLNSPKLFLESFDPCRVPGQFGLAIPPPAHLKCARETLALQRGFTDGWEQLIKLIIQEVLKEARANCSAQIPLGMFAPFQDELQHCLWFRFHELAHSNDCLPTWIALAFRRWATRQHCFCTRDGSSHARFALSR